jgi:hypothetical protein
VLGDGVDVVGLPLASAPMRSDHLDMWESYSTAIIGLRAPAAPLFYMTLREGGSLPQMADAPNQGAELETDDYFSRLGINLPNPEITFLTEMAQSTCKPTPDPAHIKARIQV